MTSWDDPADEMEGWVHVGWSACMEGRSMQRCAGVGICMLLCMELLCCTLSSMVRFFLSVVLLIVNLLSDRLSVFSNSFLSVLFLSL